MRTVAPSVARVVVAYVIVAGLWFHASDRMLEAATADPHVLARWSIHKGWAFVGFTALLLALVMSAELRARRLNEALLAAQRDLLERIARGTPAREILQRLVVLVESQVPGLTASVRLLDAAGSRAPHAVAGRWPAALVRYLDEESIDERAGPSGTAMFRDDTVLVADLASDPAWSRHRAAFSEAGLRAAWATPLRTADGKVLGTFSCYRTAPGLPGARHLKLIELATQVAAVALVREQQDNLVASQRATALVRARGEPDGWVGTGPGRPLGQPHGGTRSHLRVRGEAPGVDLRDVPGARPGARPGGGRRPIPGGGHPPHGLELRVPHPPRRRRGALDLGRGRAPVWS